MHTYRDALPAVRSARVLYPGEKHREFRALKPDTRDADGVGAIPLVPGAVHADLHDVLAKLLRGSPVAMLAAEPA